MSPIINLQRKLTEVGRIRLGARSEKGAPTKLDRFRLTSKSKEALQAASEIYGGNVVTWSSPDGDAFELVTNTNVLDVTIPPGNSLTQWYEMWSGAGCQRRCDGQTETINNTPCRCPADQSQRSELSSKGQACRPTTRLSVILPNVKTVGIWRLESHGYHAAVELAGIAELLQQVSASDKYLPATLRLEQRSAKRGGRTSRFAVPVLEVGATIQEAIAAISNTPVQPKQIATPLAVSIPEPEFEEKKETAYYTEPIKKLDELPPAIITEENFVEAEITRIEEPIKPVGDVDFDNPFEDDTITKSEIQRIQILKKELGITDEQYRLGLKQYGVTTSKNLSSNQAKEIIKKLTDAKKKKGLE